MPKQKDLKRLVRARMRKTGESYTTARAHLLARRTDAAPAARTAPARAPEPDYAKLAGMSDAAIEKATGCRWSRWVAALDHHGAAAMPHAAIAQLVHEKYKIAGWWSQAVTVGYERIRGLREKGQRRGGGYAVNKSRTFAVPVERLYAAFTAARLQHWLDAKPELRTAQPLKSVRMKWEDGTTVAIGFLRKGEAKSQVSLGHEGFPTKAQADRMRAWWTERFAVLGEEIGAG